MKTSNFYAKLIVTTVMVVIAECFLIFSVPKVHAMDTEIHNNNTGINLTVTKGQEIDVPFDSTLTILNKNTILLKNINNDEEVIVIEGIKLDKHLEEGDVHEGEKLGIAEDSYVHVCYWESMYPVISPVTERPFIVIGKLAN